MLNTVEREKKPERWLEICRNEEFQEKVCITTAVVDAGVNFKDDKLRNIVIFGHDKTQIQFYRLSNSPHRAHFCIRDESIQRRFSCTLIPTHIIRISSELYMPVLVQLHRFRFLCGIPRCSHYRIRHLSAC